MVDIPGRVAVRHRAQAPDQCRWKLRLGPQRGEGALHPGRVPPSSSWMPEPLRQGSHKTQTQLFVLYFCGTPEGWNPAQHRHTPYRTARSLSSIDDESSASPSLKRDGTSNLNKRPPWGEIRH